MEKLSLREQKALAARKARQDRALGKAIAHFGTLQALTDAVLALRLAKSRHVTLKYQSVQGWLERVTPIEWCRFVETATGGLVKAHQLNEDYADLYDRPFEHA